MYEAYAVRLEPDGSGGVDVVCRDLPQLITGGRDRASALALAVDALEVVVAGHMDLDEDLPLPTPAEPGEVLIPVRAALAAKAAVWRAWRASGLTKSDLARRMGVAETEVRRILDPGHATKLDRLDEAVRALGGRLVIGLAAE
jgi:antitoxin HicB